MPDQLTPDEMGEIDPLVAHFAADVATFHAIAANLRTLLELPPLASLYHSMRSRVKDPDHLRDKLIRKFVAAKADGKAFDLTTDNLFGRINDLAGLRLLHLHTSQFPDIDQALRALLDENRYAILEGPEARTWDDEYRAYFDGLGIKTVKSSRLYTSVHYVIQATTKVPRTAEIQVRTLAEELWGEVDHAINYPNPSTRVTCREQIRVLARVTSSCTRLVDSIFVAHNEPLSGVPSPPPPGPTLPRQAGNAEEP
jgi:putative GTP pyrophosphokinase